MSAFREAEVPFRVVGGFAVMAHGRPRTRAGIDVSVHLDVERRDELGPRVEELGQGGVEERVARHWASGS